MPPISWGEAQPVKPLADSKTETGGVDRFLLFLGAVVGRGVAIWLRFQRRLAGRRDGVQLHYLL